MSDHSAIEWTDATWNPTTGCTKVSPGCANCYIARTPPFRIKRRRFVKGRIPIEVHPQKLTAPLHWRPPRRVFVNSLSDLFHSDIPDAFIDHVFAVMALCPQHQFQVLTKRAQRLSNYRTKCSCGGDEPPTCVGIYEHPKDPPSFGCDDCCGHGNEDGFCRPIDFPLSNVWLGVSVENQPFADERIPLLLQTPAAIRFISAEPLLGPLNVEPFLWDEDDRHDALCGLDWVIVGGESGPRARPYDVAWARSILRQCAAADVPAFMKQRGSMWYDSERLEGIRRSCAVPITTPFRWVDQRDPKGGDLREWPQELRVRQFPEVQA